MLRLTVAGLQCLFFPYIQVYIYKTLYEQTTY